MPDIATVWDEHITSAKYLVSQICVINMHVYRANECATEVDTSHF